MVFDNETFLFQICNYYSNYIIINFIIIIIIITWISKKSLLLLLLSVKYTLRSTNDNSVKQVKKNNELVTHSNYFLLTILFGENYFQIGIMLSNCKHLQTKKIN